MSPGYKIGLFLTAIFLILLPLFYVACLVGLCVMEYCYFAHTFEEFSASLEKPGRRKGGLVLLYFAVPVGMLLILIVLLKPLLFGWRYKDTRFEISREREPLLFELIEHLCRFIGAPVPRRVFVDCDVNAAAGMSHGIWGAIFGGNACDLLIGLPLVAGMKTSQFIGVLAHEFGHFTQSGTRRMDYIVRTILNWFSHIYYYRDRMDLWLEGAARSGFGYFTIFFWIVVAMIWIVRRFIWGLMMLGRFVAGFMSRQMEYDADSYEVFLAGSSSFADSTKTLLKLNLANSRTISDLNYMLQEERLADNYPLLIAANMEILSEKLDPIVEKILREEKTNLVDTHPCGRDRIAAAASWKAPGILHVDLPASLLFRNFLGLGREVSLHFYRNEAEMTFDPKMLKNAGDVIDQLRRENLGGEAIIRFFQRAHTNLRFLPLSGLDATRDAGAMPQRLLLARNRQAGYARDAYEAAKAYDDTDSKLMETTLLRDLFRIGLRPKMSKTGFSFRNLRDAQQAVMQYESDSALLAARLWNRDVAAAERLFVARELLGRPDIRDRIEDGPELHRRMETIFAILEKVGTLQADWEESRRKQVVDGILVEFFDKLSDQQVKSVVQLMENHCEGYRKITGRIRTFFSGTPYPFEHGRKEATLSEFLVPLWDESEMKAFEYVQAFSILVERLFTTHHLLLGEATAMALTVEAVLGLSPLPVPPPEEE